MAFIRKRGKKYSVVYKVRDEDGTIHQKSESFGSHNEANTRKKEIEYKMAIGKFEVQKCAKLEELLQEYIKIYGRDKWGVSTYDGNISIINNYIIPTIGETDLKKINTHFLEKYYQQLLSMPAVKGSRNKDGSKTISTSTVNEIHKILRCCFRQGKKWNMMEKNPAEDATVPKT